jgi:hypothetical protein
MKRSFTTRNSSFDGIHELISIGIVKKKLFLLTWENE